MEASFTGKSKRTKVEHMVACTMRKKEQVSHKVIEKRRRDRINSCLAELSQAVPAAFVKQNSGKLEKAEILEMTVEYLRTIHALGQRIENGEWYGLNPLLYAELQRHYSAGYGECAREVMRFLGDFHTEEDSRCSRIVDFLQSRGSLQQAPMLPSAPMADSLQRSSEQEDSPAAAELRCGFRGSFCRSHHCYCQQDEQQQQNRCKDILSSSPLPPPLPFHHNHSIHAGAYPPKPPMVTVAPPMYFPQQTTPPLVRLSDSPQGGS